MDAAGGSQDSRFAHMVRRIWNGPEEAEEKSRMEPERIGETVHGRPAAYQPRRDEPYQNGRDGGRAAPPAAYPPAERPAAPDFDAGKDATVISKGTTVVGDIKSDGDVEISGAVTGSISTTGNVRIAGRQTGDVQGAAISLTACTVRGNVNAAEDVSVDSESVVVGDIKCGNLSMDGKLKGNIHVMGNVSCQGNAIVIGDITSTTLTVDSGAKIQGKLQVSDGSVEPITLPEDGPDKPSPAPSAPSKPETK